MHTIPLSVEVAVSKGCAVEDCPRPPVIVMQSMFNQVRALCDIHRIVNSTEEERATELSKLLKAAWDDGAKYGKMERNPWA
jgi:hypothetical protein